MVHQGYINHVGLVLDRSTSMRNLESSTVKVADLQIQHLADHSQTVDQETRATVYQFGSDVECIFYDKDVLRLPSIKDHYRISGMTALIDAVLQAMHDLQQTATIYGDHAFLLYVLTDGQENNSKATLDMLRKQLLFLPDNWTIAVFVPDAVGVHHAKQLGFAPGNISVWNPSEKGIREVGETIQRTTSAYMQMRTTGQRSTTGLFELNVGGLTPSVIRGNLVPVPSDRFGLYSVIHEGQIRDFVEFTTGRSYRIGDSFYELTKPEKVQSSKQIMIREVKTGKVYSGHDARSILGLPNHEVKVAPTDHPDYDIFVQSTSVNRKLIPGQSVIIVNR